MQFRRSSPYIKLRKFVTICNANYVLKLQVYKLQLVLLLLEPLGRKINLRNPHLHFLLFPGVDLSIELTLEFLGSFDHLPAVLLIVMMQMDVLAFMHHLDFLFWKAVAIG